MKKTLWLLVGILMVPAVMADLYIPILMKIWAFRMYLLIPIILVEGIAAYFIFRGNVGFFKSLLIFTAANLVTTALGFLMLHIPLLHSNNLLWMLPAYLFTTLAEVPIIQVFIRKIEKPWTNALIASSIVNALSYAILLALALQLVYV